MSRADFRFAEHSGRVYNIPDLKLEIKYIGNDTRYYLTLAIVTDDLKPWANQINVHKDGTKTFGLIVEMSDIALLVKESKAEGIVDHTGQLLSIDLSKLNLEIKNGKLINKKNE